MFVSPPFREPRRLADFPPAATQPGVGLQCAKIFVIEMLSVVPVFSSVFIQALPSSRHA